MEVKLPRAKRYKKQMNRYASADCKHDSSLLPFSTAKSVYNFDFSSGTLRKGYGVKSHELVPPRATRYWVYRFFSEEKGQYVEHYFYQYNIGWLLIYDPDKDKQLVVTGMGYNPIDVVNYRLNSVDVLLISSEGRKLVTWNGKKLVEYQSSPSILSMAVHYERLFVTSRDERTKVYFSKNLDPTQWEIGEDGGGFIELLDERGYLNKVVSFGSYLYIFRDHGISRVSAYGDQSEFTVVNMFVTGGRIFPSSIATCGNCIMFLASDGLYVFDGLECTRVLTDISPLIVPDDSCASAYFDGKYYLACKMDFKDGKTIGSEANEDYKTNGLLVYDLNSHEYSISRGLDISFMNACSYMGNDFLMCCESGVGGVIEKGAALFDDELPSYWESGVTDMSAPDKVKCLTNVIFTDDSGEVDLGVCVDGTWYNIKPGGGTNNIGLNLRGYKFAFSLQTSGAKINATPLCVKYEEY